MAPKKGVRTARRHPTLSGVRIVVGRAHHQAGALSDKLRKLGARVIEIPFIEIRRPRSYKPLDTALKNLSNYDLLILTSVNGVEAVWNRLRQLHMSRKALQHLKIAAIGPATREAIRQRGLRVHVMPKKYLAESVVASLRNRVKGKRVLLARAKVARDVIPHELRELGARVDVVEAYETVQPTRSRKKLLALFSDEIQRPQVITFTSSSTVRNFVALLSERGPGRPRHTEMLDGIRLASIGPVTSGTLRELRLPVDIEARDYTIPGLIEAIVNARPTVTP